MDFHPFLKAVGTGPKGNKDLTVDETCEAITAILQGQVSPEVIGAFLLGLRVKIESDEELLGTKKALDAMISPQQALAESVEVSYTFEGKKKHPFLLPLMAKELTQTALVASIDSDLTPQGVTLLQLQEKKLLPDNIHLQDRAHYLLWLSALNSLRHNLKLRTVFNTVEKLLNPLKSSYAIIGAHHTPYFKKYQLLFGSSYERLIILQGDEGSGEVYKKGKAIIIDSGQEVEQLTIDPKEFDIDTAALPQTHTLQEMVTVLQHPDKNLQNLAKLNARVVELASKQRASLL